MHTVHGVMSNSIKKSWTVSSTGPIRLVLSAALLCNAPSQTTILYGPGGIFIFVNKYQDGLLFRDLQRAIHRRPGMLKDIHRRFIMYQLLSATRYLHAGNGKHNLFCISVYCTAIFKV